MLFGHDHVSRINRILISIFSFFIFIFRNVKLTVTWLYLIWLYPRVSKTVRFVTNQKIICHRFVTPGWSLYVTIFYSLNNQNWDIFSKYNYFSFKGPTDDRDFKDPTEDRDFEDPTNNQNFKDPQDQNGFESKLKENLLTTVPLESSTSAKKRYYPGDKRPNDFIWVVRVWPVIL